MSGTLVGAFGETADDIGKTRSDVLDFIKAGPQRKARACTLDVQAIHVFTTGQRKF
jgi:hypothetical protein